MFPVHLQPVCHHTEEPNIKEIPPLLVFAWHTIGKGTDAVLPVPMRQIEKELLDRPVMGNTPGVHVTLHVIFDCRYPFQLRLETDAFNRLGRHRAIVRKQRMSFAILLASLHPVEPQLITPCHKLFHLHRHQHPPGHTGPYAAMFFFPVDVPERRPQLHLLLPAERVYQGKTDGIFLRDGGLPAFTRQMHDELFPSFIATVFRPDLPKGVGKAGFIKERYAFVAFIAGRHAQQRVRLGIVCLACRHRSRHLQRLFQADRQGIRIIIQVGIIRHTASLFRRRASFFFPFDGQLELCFVIASCTKAGMGVKKAHMPFRLRQRTVRQGKRNHDFNAPSARSYKRSECLRKSRRPVPYGSRLRLTDQVTDTEQHQSCIGGHTDPLIIPLQRNAKQNYRYLFCCKAFYPGSQIRNVLPQGGHRLPAIFRFHGVQDNA